MGWFKLLTKDDRQVDDTNPLPVKMLPVSGGTGSTADVAGYTKITNGINTAQVDNFGSQPAVIKNGTGVEVGTTGNPFSVRTVNTGTQGNAWNGASVAANGNSSSIDLTVQTNISVFGNSSAATTITVQFSQDNTNFYDSIYNQNLAAAGNFGFSFSAGARYIRLKSSAAATITACIAGK